MKILSSETYNNLIQENARLKVRVDNLLMINEATIKKLTEMRERFSMSFSIRRFIVGPNASGKSLFLKKVVIPKLDNNYFLVDVNNEYDFVPIENKYVLDKKLSGKKLRDSLLKMFHRHSSKVIILEDAMIFDRDISWFFYGTNRNRPFMIVSHTLNSIAKYIQSADQVYDFGAQDYNQRNTDVLNEAEMDKLIPMSLDKFFKPELQNERDQ